MSAALALWSVLAVAGSPDYDAFSEADGFIAEHQELAAWRMRRDADQLEAVHADAVKGNERAARVIRQLEATLAASGRELAERLSRPGCLVPGAQQLERTCRLDWSFLDFPAGSSRGSGRPSAAALDPKHRRWPRPRGSASGKHEAARVQRGAHRCRADARRVRKCKDLGRGRCISRGRSAPATLSHRQADAAPPPSRTTRIGEVMSLNQPFDFQAPRGYSWLVERGLVGFQADTALQPWHFLPQEHAFDLSARWPEGPSKTRLVAFAKRQDCDDLACFEVNDQRAQRIVLVHGWTSGGYEIISIHDSFWTWLKTVVDDIAEWVEAAADPEGRG